MSWQTYWFQGDTERSRLLALRWVLFGLVAFDMWTIMLGHSSRYGAGLLNVVQIDTLQGVAPIPFPSIVVLFVITAGFSALLAAFGVWVRGNIIIACLGYSTVYLWSQADSYQHHYLVALLMFICCFVPNRIWQPMNAIAASTDAQASDEGEGEGEAVPRLWHWAIQLIYVQVGIVYFWTAWTKMDPTWMTGLTMDQLTSEPCIRDDLYDLAADQDVSPALFYRYAAILVVIGEFFAAFAFIIPKLRIIGLFIVPWFHIGVEMLGFDIEWFSYYMIGINLVLLSPSLVWRAIDRFSHRLGTHPNLKFTSSILNRWPNVALGRVGIVLATALAVYLLSVDLPFPGWSESLALAIAGIAALSILGPVDLVWRQYARPRRGVSSVFLTMLAAWLMVQSIKASEITFDFYRNWAGDFKRRQKFDKAIEHYALANEVKGPSGPARVMNIADVLVTKAKKYRRASRKKRQDAIRLKETITREQSLNPDRAVILQSQYDALVAEIEPLRREADRLEHEDAYGYYQNAVQRLEPYMTESRKSASKAQTDADLYFDLASDELRAHSRYRKLSSAMRNRSSYLTRRSALSDHKALAPADDFSTWRSSRLAEAARLLEEAKSIEEKASIALSGAKNAIEKAQDNEKCPGPDQRRTISQVRRARG